MGLILTLIAAAPATPAAANANNTTNASGSAQAQANSSASTSANTTSPAHAQVNRQAWIEGTYKKMPTLLQTLATSGLIEDEETKAFLANIETFFDDDVQPPLVFVDDSKQFIINPGERPRLMRAPEGQDQPIFINRARFSEPGLKLSLPQLIKLLLHELGHKTGLANVEKRDQWAQEIENLLQNFYFTTGEVSSSRANQIDTSSEPGERVIEMISFSRQAVQAPKKTTQPMMVRPTFLLFIHNKNSVTDLTDIVLAQLSERSMLMRNLSTDVNMALTEVADLFKDLMKDHVAPALDEVIGSLSKAFGAKPPEVGMTESVNKFNGNLQYISVFDTKKVSTHNDILVIDGELGFLHSHSNTASMKMNGLPFAKTQNLSVKILVSLNEHTPEAQRVRVQADLPLEVQSPAKVKSIKRSNGQVVGVEVEFKRSTTPYMAELVLNYEHGHFRVRGSDPRRVSEGTYRAEFELTGTKANLAEFAYSMTVDSQVNLPLDREVLFKTPEASPKSKGHGELRYRPDSVGIWVNQAGDFTFQNTFSHLEPPLLFPVGYTDNKVQIINPSGFWAEFEIEEGVEVIDAEIFMSVDQFILDAREKDKDGNIISHYQQLTLQERVADEVKDQRYTTGGTLLDSKVTRLGLSMFTEHINVLPSSTPGYRKLRIPTATSIPHIRDLADPIEAHRVPSVIPHSIRVTTADGRSFTHNFASKIEASEVMKSTPLCEALLNKRGSTAARDAK